ncbi:DNA-binding response regulator [candidate division GN15 bacterium]|uniref:DNA-binding response regulator n=1 Tax=candidate division GN15 bacterium TaxID=2072418 RepID=A0A855X5X6_9BACT|nr:MAG: DNA-binding response regulator [candidate division GN15 bacterium]
MRTILLVEDDLHLAEGLTLNLEAEGYQVVHVSDGTQAMPAFEKGMFDLVLMDIMLPGMDGLTICKKIRAAGHTLPVLFITARDETDQKIEGLLAGGDDYITKPFNVQELLARIAGIFRRQAWLAADEQVSDSYSFDGRTINFKTYEATGPGGKVVLTRKECMVVKYLVERAGEVVSRDQLLDAVWGYHAYPTNRTVDNFILKLRKIFEDDPKEPKYFETIRAVGYRFNRG